MGLEYLTAEQLATFRDDGYLVLPEFFSHEQADALLQRSKQLLADFSLDGHPLTAFSTGGENDEARHVGDEYFLSSGTKIHYFFETEAFKDGQLVKPKEQAINKFGHALHELDPVFKDFTFQERTRAVARDLNVHRDPRVLQSMVITKQPQIGGALPAHADATFLYTEKTKCVGFWFALEDCSLDPVDNGCLSFLPGSHKRNRISERFVRGAKGGTEFAKVEGVEPIGIDWEKEQGWKTVEVKRGGLVLIDGLVMHRSTANRSTRSRYIYTYHCIDGSEPYDKLNWLQPTPEMPFSKLLDS